MAGILLFDLAILVGTLYAILWAAQRTRAWRRFPPGPKGLPFFGNVFDIPVDNAHITFQQISRDYTSDVISLNLMGTPVVVLNSMSAVVDLIEKRSSMYSDRPRLVMLGDLIKFDWSQPLMPYGDDWRMGRKMFSHVFQPSAIHQWQHIERDEVRRLLVRLIQDPDDISAHLRFFTASVIFRIAYGVELPEKNDILIKIAERAAHVVTVAGAPGAYLVETFPILRHIPEWMPGGGFKTDAKRFRDWADALLHVPFDSIKEKLCSDELSQCAATKLFENFVHGASDKEYTEYITQCTLATMYLGGADTTVSTLSSFVLAMALHPDVQAKARAELDTVVGADRLPDFYDKPSLPYITAIMKETLRWNPVIPIGVPRFLNEDDEYNGMYIPKGSRVLVNSWAILHDECMYPDPLAFNPDRFMLDGKLNPAIRDPASAGAFGFGRRICAGRFLAQEELWLTMAAILATFTIGDCTDMVGGQISPETAFMPGFLVHPKPFKCSMTPRSGEHEALVQSLV
ncbi:hypothetical protein CERSUDRAFT_113891 [Gelatoporia subvermispora B]|uniref:Cytochrome P450 n=1 Tax=Ceriporiopsis subvermispora (strain B) TaxID=914234 RepID=M2PLK5_CERS8|nr:hypothetical protein CERSUDRAFT_113891 [Gelatoporia subvermispora B]